MKQLIPFRSFLLSVLVFSLALAAFATPTVSDLSVRQRWPWSRLVDIRFTLSGIGTAEMFDPVFTASNGGNLLGVLPTASLSGDIKALGDNRSYHAVFDPTQANLGVGGVLSDFQIDISFTSSPLYVVVDLTKDVAAGATDNLTYITAEDLNAGLYGSCATNPVSVNGVTITSLVWTAVTDEQYKTSRLVLRRIPAGSAYRSSSAIPAITLTKPFYAGVFEFSQGQWKTVTGSYRSTTYTGDDRSLHPIEQISYDALRGTTNFFSWPVDGHAVAPSSFLSTLRSRTGLALLDLPTAAQFEYLYRAGTRTDYCNGYNTDNIGTNLANIAWYSANAGSITRRVGGKNPNAWGIYDVAGNVWEWALDWTWYASSARLTNIVKGTDPVGPQTSASSSPWRLMTGGGFKSTAEDLPASIIGPFGSEAMANSIGFRVVWVDCE